MSAAGGAWGARNGPWIIRRALDSGRPGRYLSVLVFTVCFTAFVGAVAALGALLGYVWLVLLFGLPSVGGVATTVTVLTRWWWNRRPQRGAVLTIAPSGAPATAYLRSRAALLPAAAIAFGFLALGVTTVVVGALNDSIAGVVVGGLVAAYALLLVLPFLTGADAGGVYLTRGGVEHRWGLTTTSVPWASLLAPRAHVPFGLWLPPDAQHRTGRPLIMPTDVTDTVPKGYAAVPPAFLPLTMDELIKTLETLQATPSAQAQLGTPESLLWDLTGRAGVVERWEP
ncbi:MAG: hypothetical protein ABWX84_15080 [Nocardioides sp.]